MTIAVFAPDLGDRTRIGAAVPDAVFVRSVRELAGADIAVLDLSRPGALEVVDDLVAACGRVVAFGPHVAADALAAASDAGAEALPRSRFFRDVAALLGGS